MINRKSKSIIILFLFFSGIFLPKILISREKPERTPEEWTLMLYFCADTREETVSSSLDNSNNFLYQAMYATMGAIPGDLAEGSQNDINVIALFDYPYSISYPYGNAVIRELSADGTLPVATWGQTNMGDDVTLSNFISYCKTNYPADHYALVLSNHGRGYAGFCYDYHAPHPYAPYALGDCLTVPEVETALSGTNNVDVIIFNTCLGGSFEVAWQLVDEASYMVAGESGQEGDVLYHPREIAYALSRDTDMTPLELAQAAFDGGSSPTVLPASYAWDSISLYDLTKFDIGAGGPSFKEKFYNFTDSLFDEITHNATKITFFHELRNELMTHGLDSSESMMIDLYNFLQAIVAHEADFYYNETNDLASDLIGLLDSGSSVLIDEFHYWSSYSHLHGFSLCFPDSPDMYHGFLYPNMYGDLKISLESMWNQFIFRLFPSLDFDRFRIPDLYHIFIHPLDPVTQLHVIFESEYLDEPLHVGLNDDFFHEPMMGIELGIEGAEYHDDLLWGSAMIRIPTQSLQIGGAKATEEQTFKIIINASAVASPTQEVNLTVKHILNDETVWQEIQEKTVEAGQVLSCEVSTNDTMSEWEEEEPSNTEPPTTSTPPNTSTSPTDSSPPETSRTGFIGATYGLIIFVSSLLTTTIILVVYRRRKKI